MIQRHTYTHLPCCGEHIQNIFHLVKLLHCLDLERFLLVNYRDVLWRQYYILPGYIKNKKCKKKMVKSKCCVFSGVKKSSGPQTTRTVGLYVCFLFATKATLFSLYQTILVIASLIGPAGTVSTASLLPLLLISLPLSFLCI